ncbi:MAG: glycosyltransferase [Acidobacteria bacterium]|nr:glycosyltransferase [Acidobacteriota bacterium]MBV9071316.1 glycosyltransferase [Acidobacteriota bacterium]MBV9188154.1 glycosyltransferase [Acidobacteriota bacterium]
MKSTSTSDLRAGLSVVVPVYNSEQSLTPLVERLHTVLPSLAGEWEILLINDGSRDRSWEVVRDLAARYPQVCGIRMMRNFGQHNALLAGVRAARYSVIVTMDDDLQHQPEEIPKLLAKLASGEDVVYGTPVSLPHGLWRNFFSRFTKRAFAYAMRIDDLVDITAFRAFRTELRGAFQTYSSPQVLIDVLLSWGTTKFSSVKCEHLPRTIGRSNYTPGKLFNQAMLILTGFSTAPLRLASSVGFVFTLFGLTVLAYVVGRYLITGASVPGFPFLASAIAIFSGAQLFALGIIGEYLARIFNRTVEQPAYVIKETTEPPDSSHV